MTTAILLLNLGTPDAPTAPAVKRYLAEFLGDPRVVELPRLLWLPILHGIILRTRPFRSARKYRKIWTERGSPRRSARRRRLSDGVCDPARSAAVSLVDSRRVRRRPDRLCLGAPR